VSISLYNPEVVVVVRPLVVVVGRGFKTSNAAFPLASGGATDAFAAARALAAVNKKRDFS
jgi:hypothetical protein